jgi:hypothetical protein
MAAAAAEIRARVAALSPASRAANAAHIGSQYQVGRRGHRQRGTPGKMNEIRVAETHESCEKVS